VVVNDDPVQLRQMAGILLGAGHEVSSFLDAGDALAGLAGRATVSLFVVDLHMPGIDGWKLCRLLRSPEFGRFNDTPILVVSATFTGDDVASITRELGANGFLEAPFEARRLVEFAATLLAGEVPRTDQTVLIVEDDEAVRKVLSRAFLAHGYLVAEAATGAEARRVWRSGHMDVVLLDYHLPDGSSEHLIDEFRGPTNRTSVLVMTGDTDPVLPVRLLGRGADGYLRKPFEPGFAIELARKAGRQRALLRIESILESRTRELRASEERYRMLFETIPDVVLVMDRRGHVVQINPDGLRYLETTEDEVLGRHVVEVARPERARELSRWVGALERGETSLGLETELQGPGGRAFPVELTGRSVEFRGEPAILVVGRDLTERNRAEDERRRMETQMQHAQRLESLGVLAGGVAHDFNNLLVGILGNASLAVMDLPDGSPVRDSIHQIELAARRAAELTQQILAFAGKAKVAFQDVDLSGLVREMGQLLEPAVSKKARMSYRLSPRVPLVRADASQIRQVMMNLLINASDALSGKPGDITVQTSLKELPADGFYRVIGGGTPAPGRYVVLEVTDTGCGMDEETCARIFEPFFTTKFAGRGLGLAATLGVIRAHNGFVAVRTEVGQGTTMTVLFPALPTSATLPPTQAGGGASKWSQGGTILVVDDEPAVRGLARAVLTRGGFTVVEAKNGREGADLILVEDTPVDLVLMDVSMPELDGHEALTLLRRTRPTLPVLMSSGYPPEKTLEAAARGEPTGFLKKPYAPTELMDAVSSLLWKGQDCEGTANPS
jgi:PAS domain S-box-containing protein